MCELFALFSRIPTTVGFTLERLARRGGIEGPHRDGWGVAFYDGTDVFLLREPRAAAESDLVRYIEQHEPPILKELRSIVLSIYWKISHSN